MKEYIVRPIPLSGGTRDKGLWTYRLNYGQPCSSCCYVWYIEGTEPKVLVDSGASLDSFLALGLKQQAIQTLEEGLAKLGLQPEDISVVIQTHLHWDHIELAYKFPRAKFIVQKAELDYARNPHQVSRGSYDQQMLENPDFEVVDGDKEIMEGIQVMLTPGHSPGGQSVAINTREGNAIITGFCCTLDTFQPPPGLKAQCFEVVIPGLHINAEQAYDSVLRVKETADVIFPLHEAAFKHGDSMP